MLVYSLSRFFEDEKTFVVKFWLKNEGQSGVSMFINQNFTTFVSSRVSSRFWWKHKYKITLFLTKCSWVFLRFSTQNFQFWVIVHWPNGVFGLQAGGSGTKLYPRYSGQRWDSSPILEQLPTIKFLTSIKIVKELKFSTTGPHKPFPMI